MLDNKYVEEERKISQDFPPWRLPSIMLLNQEIYMGFTFIGAYFPP